MSRARAAVAPGPLPEPLANGGGAPARRAPRELLRPWILLLLGQSSSHGYGLAADLRRLGVDVGDVGVVYNALRRLEQAGLASSLIDPQIAGPARRVYRLTPVGLAARENWVASIRSLHTWLRQATK